MSILSTPFQMVGQCHELSCLLACKDLLFKTLFIFSAVTVGKIAGAVLLVVAGVAVLVALFRKDDNKKKENSSNANDTRDDCMGLERR